MADEPIPFKAEEGHLPPDDAVDINSLWLDPSLGDGLVDTHFHSIAIGKPKDFYRVNPDPAYRRRTEIYTHKVDGVIDEQTFIIAPSMRGRIEERPILVRSSPPYTATVPPACGRSSCQRTTGGITKRGRRLAPLPEPG
jgi:hypothetical protein